MSVFDEVTDAFQELADQNPEQQEFLQESLSRVQTMLQLEDRDWLNMYSGVISGDDNPGPDLELAQGVAEAAREMAYGSPLISRGLDLRTSYVWSKGVVIEGAPETQKNDSTEGRRRGPKSKKEKFFSDPGVSRYLNSSEAHKDMEGAAFTDGHFMFLGDDSKRTGHPVPFSEIDGVYLNPEYSGEVLAYRRNYSVQNSFGVSTPKIVWLYVDTYTGDRKNPQPEIDGVAQNVSGIPVTVDKGKTLFVKSFNTMTGWPIGVGDALPALKYARIYAEMVQVGIVVSKANAKFVYKVKNTTPKGALNAAAKVSSSQGSGNVAALGNNNDLTAIPQSNRSYDFNGIRPIASQVATALNVSVVHILSDPGAAGSSYGSASNLDLPTKRAMVSRQSEWVDFLQRVFKWGTGEDLKVSFPSLDDPDPYREMQLVTMGWNAGVIHPEEMRDRSIEIGGFTPLEEGVPKGVMLPNNEKSLNRADIDSDSTASASNATPNNSTSPDQGKTNGTGGVSNSASKDLRDEAMQQSIDDLRAQVQALATFLESRSG